MRPRYGVLALLVGAFVALGVVACGGDDDGEIVPVEEQTTPPDELSQEEFIDEADAICEEGNIAIANLADTSAGDPTTALGEERELVGGMLDQLNALGAPGEDESTLDAFVDALEELADNLDKQELAAERGDATSLAELETEETTIRTEIATAAEDYGFKECGQEGEATVDAGTDTGVGDGTGTDSGVAPAPAPAPAPEPAAGGSATNTEPSGEPVEEGSGEVEVVPVPETEVAPTLPPAESQQPAAQPVPTTEYEPS
jgi:hypothetical protein